LDTRRKDEVDKVDFAFLPHGELSQRLVAALLRMPQQCCDNELGGPSFMAAFSRHKDGCRPTLAAATKYVAAGRPQLPDEVEAIGPLWRPRFGGGA